MSSVMNVLAAVVMGPLYATLMAVICALIRMGLMGIPPLALTGAVFGACLAGWGYRLTHHYWGAVLGEIIGTGVIGSLLSFPVMVWFTGSTQSLYWFVYTPRFFGGAISGSVIALVVLFQLDRLKMTTKLQQLFTEALSHVKPTR
jgi:energy coupling factor transporter S component ThiW